MEAEAKFLSIVGGGAAGALLFAFGIHYLATMEEGGVAVQGKLLRRTDGSPVADALLYASETPVMVLSRGAQAQESIVLGGTQAEPLQPLGKSAADGSFQIEVSRAPGASVLAAHPELAAVLVRASRLREANGTLAVPVETPCGLRGEAYDEQGNPLRGAFVSLVPFGEKEKPRWQTWTDEAGKFRFERLPVGRLTVSILFPQTASAVNAEYSTSAVVSISAGEQSFIHFGPSGLLLGKVKDAEGNVIRNAEVVVRSTGISAEGRLAANLRTKANGEYRLFALSPTQYRGFIRNPDPESQPAWFDAGTITPPRSGEKWYDLQISPATAKIRIAPESAIDYPFPTTNLRTGGPAVRRLLLYPQGTSQASYELNSEMGKDLYDPQFAIFAVPHVVPGVYTVMAKVEGYGAGIEEEYNVPPVGDPSLLALTVTRGGPVIVQVVDPEKKPIPSAIVSVWLEDRIEIVRGGPGDELWPGPGTFILRVEAGGYKTKSQQFYVLVSSTKSFEVVLEPEGAR